MYLTGLAFCAAAFLTSVHAQSYPGCKGGLYALVGRDVSKYPPAQTFCSSKFPVPVQTSTIVAPTQTRAQTVYITATTTGTATVTTTYSTSTSTLTTHETATITFETTTTITVPYAKRADPTSDKWKSILSQASAFVGAVCTCIEKPKTTSVTTTPTVTATTTATTTVSITTTSTASVVATISTTETNTVTTTTTVTATATVTAAPKPDYNQCSGSNTFCANSESCVCYPTTDNVGECSTNGGSCGQPCNTGADCPNSRCVTQCRYSGYAGGCTPDNDLLRCRTSSTSARLLFARGSKLGQARDVEARAVAHRPYIEPPSQ
ncbi:uncharacterized protein EKO05_0011248 [Ascochyta rabiei]|uniref:uncharacterized protein n=1 Tax=Didymella rabiei TaxID=5454 RepID=UPI00220CFA11|nr:uncharacterized protein EKO05_0011248 [Ascochyta rabiei]UPX21042.1 hypothetical protein EKO05_0011248 [Ascochyta rabiei]